LTVVDQVVEASDAVEVGIRREGIELGIFVVGELTVCHGQIHD